MVAKGLLYQSCINGIRKFYLLPEEIVIEWYSPGNEVVHNVVLNCKTTLLNACLELPIYVRLINLHLPVFHSILSCSFYCYAGDVGVSSYNY